MMSELERLDEALKVVGRRITIPSVEVDLVLAAARKYRDLLANGQRVEWCETHDNVMATLSFCWKVLAVGPAHLRDEEAKCSKVSKLLSVYPKEAENGR